MTARRDPADPSGQGIHPDWGMVLASESPRSL